MTASTKCKRLTIQDSATWYQAGDRQIFLADVVNSSNSNTMSVGFARYDKGESNEWIVTASSLSDAKRQERDWLTYDEALIVTKGVFTVRSTDDAATAKADEVIFLTKGTKVTYQGEEDNTEVVYVSYPHWFDAQRNSQHADLLDNFHPI